MILNILLLILILITSGYYVFRTEDMIRRLSTELDETSELKETYLRRNHDLEARILNIQRDANR